MTMKVIIRETEELLVKHMIVSIFGKKIKNILLLIVIFFPVFHIPEL